MRINKREVARFCIAVLLGIAAATVFEVIEAKYIELRLLLSNSGFFQQFMGGSIFDYTVLTLVWSTAFLVCASLVSVTSYCLILKPKGDNETRCRKCGYILKGITEPKCSECGEVI